MSLYKSIFEQVQATLFIDTHEHFYEESLRVEKAEKNEGDLLIAAPDFSTYFANYPNDELIVAGMPEGDNQKFFGSQLSPLEKWKLVEPYYQRCRHTGYLQSARESLRILDGEEDFTAHNVESISRAVAERIKPGFYETILKEHTRVEYCQVNALAPQDPLPAFRNTAQPELLAQDLSSLGLSSSLNIDFGQKLSGIEVKGLQDWLQVIEWVFAEYAPRAIAVKDQGAYLRVLDYRQVPQAEAEKAFNRYLQDPEKCSPEEVKAIQDFAFHHCLRQAQEYDLTYKLHTGFLAGHGGMQLGNIKNHGAHLSPLFRDYPKLRFDLFHITYPYYEEAIALSKQYPNVYLDMCWAWIINPLASKRFLKDFIVTSPVQKVFTFGGDYGTVELSVGHAEIARRGIAQALTELVEDGHLREKDIPDLVGRLMNGNARECFDYGRSLEGWKKWQERQAK